MLVFDRHQDMKLIESGVHSNEFLGGVHVSTRVLSLMKGVEDIVGNTIDLVNLQELQRIIQFKGFTGSTLSTRMKSVTYVSLRALPVNIPQGMATSFPNYLSALEQAAAFIADSPSRTLEPTQKYLGRLIGNPSELTGTLPNKIAIDSEVRHKELDTIKTLVGGCFDAKSNATASTFGGQFSNVAEWEESCIKADGFEKKLKAMKFEKLQSESDALAAMSKSLRRHIESGDTNYTLSGYMAGEISKVLYNLADEIEFIGAFMQLSRSLCVVFQENVTSLSSKIA